MDTKKIICKFDYLHKRKVWWEPSCFANHKIEGILYVDGSSLFVCQNELRGANAPDTFKYLYSYHYSIHQCGNEWELFQYCNLSNRVKIFSI
jgi:hypothetical protein